MLANRRQSLSLSSRSSATPLMLACSHGSVSEVRALIKKVGVDRRDRSGKTALHYATDSHQPACAELVLNADPSIIDVQDEEGYTALHLAVINGNIPVARFLLSRNADSNKADKEKHSIVHWATVCGELECLDLLFEVGANAATPDIHGAYPLHYAAQMCGPSGEMGNGDTQTGLAVLRKLIQLGMNVNVCDQDGRHPLLWAASAGSSDAILALVNAGASVTSEDKDGLTALHCAASRGHVDCIETLICLCAAVCDVVDGNGCTPLFYSVTLGHADCTELLLQHGSNPNRQDRKGRTPAHCGASKGQLETLKLLSQHCGNMWTKNIKGDVPLHEAIQSGRKDLVKWLLQQRIESVNFCNNDGRAPLHLAAINGNVEMCKVLMDRKASVNPIMQTRKGILMTPLDSAVSRGNRSCAKYLQLHGGVPAVKFVDKYGVHQTIGRIFSGRPDLAKDVTLSPNSRGTMSNDVSLESSFDRGSLQSKFSEKKDAQTETTDNNEKRTDATVTKTFKINMTEGASEQFKKEVIITDSEKVTKKAISDDEALKKKPKPSEEGVAKYASDTELHRGHQRIQFTSDKPPREVERNRNNEGSNGAIKTVHALENFLNGTRSPTSSIRDSEVSNITGTHKDSGYSEDFEDRYRSDQADISSTASNDSKMLNKRVRRRKTKSKHPVNDQVAVTHEKLIVRDGSVDNNDSPLQEMNEEEERKVMDNILDNGIDVFQNKAKTKVHRRLSNEMEKPKSHTCLDKPAQKTRRITKSRIRRKHPKKLAFDVKRSVNVLNSSLSSDGYGALQHRRQSRSVEMPRATRPVVNSRAKSHNYLSTRYKPENHYEVMTKASKSMRKYYLERQIFERLLEIKRLQIRCGRANEQVLVKRLAEEHAREYSQMGIKLYNGPLNLKAFEKYLYDVLRDFSVSNHGKVPVLKNGSDLYRSFEVIGDENNEDLASSYKRISDSYGTIPGYWPLNDYTSGKKSTTLPRLNPSKLNKPSRPSKLSANSINKLSARTRILSCNSTHELVRKSGSTEPVTFEIKHGAEKNVFTLPTNEISDRKKWQVTFTIGMDKNKDGKTNSESM
ncbi:nphp-2 (predicted) [Pycnogonum litorale]